MALISTKVGDLPSKRRVYLPFRDHRKHRRVMAHTSAWFAVRDTLIDSAVAAHAPLTVREAFAQAGRIARLLESEGVVRQVASGQLSALEATEYVRWSQYGKLAMVKVCHPPVSREVH